MARISGDAIRGKINEMIARDTLSIYQEALDKSKDYDRVQQLYGGIKALNELLDFMETPYTGENYMATYLKVEPIISGWVIKDE